MMEEDGGSVNARKSVNKSLLKNIMRHTDAHNKVLLYRICHVTFIIYENVGKTNRNDIEIGLVGNLRL